MLGRVKSIGGPRCLKADKNGRCYLAGQGDLVSRLIIGITRVTIWFIGVSNLLTKLLSPPDPPSRCSCLCAYVRAYRYTLYTCAHSVEKHGEVSLKGYPEP